MPTSSSAATFEKRKTFRSQQSAKSVERNNTTERSDNFLTIESAFPSNEHKKLTKRSYSTLTSASLAKTQKTPFNDPITVQAEGDGSVRILRTTSERDTHPDRICLDRRGLNTFPIIDGEIKLRLLSLQHNLITNLDGLKSQNFPYLVFLDVYDNQLEQMTSLNVLENLRVLLLGKNRLKKIEGLNSLKKVEVLDLHGNQISQITGLSSLSELKVLNLAGNQLRFVGTSDFFGLGALQELNLRRNKLRKLMGFGETPNLSKLFISNNDLQSVEDISSLAKSTNLKEISIDNNPVFLNGDCASFLVSYLPHLIKLNTMQITEQVRKAALAWRRNKELTNSAFMDLTSDVCLNVRREEIISNARTNWELLRSQTKCLTKINNTTSISKSTTNCNNNLNLDSDLILTSLGNKMKTKPALSASITTKVPHIFTSTTTNKKLIRTSSQDTDNSQNTSSSNNSSSNNNEFIRLPPILVPIIKKMEQKSEASSVSVKLSGSVSSIGPNIDSSSSLGSEDSPSASSSDTEPESDEEEPTPLPEKLPREEPVPLPPPPEKKPGETSSTISSNSDPSSSSHKKDARSSVKSAVNAKICQKWQGRAATARAKRQPSPKNPPPAVKDREQGGDYLIEISGRYLNIYGQCALRFIDKNWSPSKANDVNSVKFNYVNFNGITNILNKLKLRFPNIDHFYFKETNIHCLGQLNGLAEVQGLSSLYIDAEGNPIVAKSWRSYAVYRLAHWGLSVINDCAVTEEETRRANEEFQGLSDLVLWSLPDVLLQPLLVRLRLDVSYGVAEKNVKKWLLTADPDLKSVVSKEALQWKKAATSAQEDQVLRLKAKNYISNLLEEMGNSVNKLRLLDEKWPGILHEFVRNALLDYSQLDMYMKRKISELR